MKQPITVSIATDGTIRFLVTPDSHCLMTATSTVYRASHVEPVNRALRFLFYALRTRTSDTGLVATFTRLWPCLWRVNLSPVNGPILPDTYRNRKQAIAKEIQWLTVNFL